MLKRIGAFILDILQIIFFALAIFLFVYLLILQPHKIKGGSMEPNFRDGEFLLTDKVSYRFNKPKRGDVVVFQAPPNNQDEYIKRIIGLPGEELTIQRGKIYIDNKLIEEKYLDPASVTKSGNFSAEGKVIKIPENTFFVIGDNRDHSYDSRSWGVIEKNKITGRAWFVYWPPQKAGLIEKAEYSF